MYTDVFLNFIKTEKRLSSHTVKSYSSDLKQFSKSNLLGFEACQNKHFCRWSSSVVVGPTLVSVRSVKGHQFDPLRVIGSIRSGSSIIP